MPTSHFSAPAPPTDAVPGRVLVVDDEPDIRATVSTLLGADGHEVDTAAGVEEALLGLSAPRYDVVLLDLHMPGQSGLDLLGAIAGRGLDVVPILLTGTNDVAVAVEAMKQGAFDYLPKPPRREALLWAVRRALGVARARRHERALARAVSHWEATFDACPDLLLVLDPQGRVLRANRAAAERAGADRAALTGLPVEAVFPHGLGAAVRAYPSDAPPAGQKVFDARLGGHFLLSVTAFPTAEGGAAVAVIRDVNDLTRGEEERKALLQRLLTAQEDEQRRLARELHDGIGQTLASLAVGLQWEGERGERLRQIATDGQDEVRRLVRGLRPMLLDDLGLSAALARLAEQVTRLDSLRVEFVPAVERDGRLAPDVESALYRIAQEALSNAVKYSGARAAEVLLEVSADRARLSVSDDGTGFAPSRGVTGFGILGMRERAQLLGGALTVESGAGRGTTVTAVVPLGAP